MRHEVCRQDVDVVLVCFYIRIVLRYNCESLIPEGHSEYDTVRLGGGCDVFLARARQFEGIRDNAVASSTGENSLLNCHLSIRIAMQAAPHFRIFSLTVFPDDDEINVAGPPAGERCYDPIQQPYGAAINVLPKTAPDRDEQSPKRNVVRNTGVSNRSQVDRVEWL